MTDGWTESSCTCKSLHFQELDGRTAGGRFDWRKKKPEQAECKERSPLSFSRRTGTWSKSSKSKCSPAGIRRALYRQALGAATQDSVVKTMVSVN